MARTQGAFILRHIRKLAAIHSPGQQSDMHLLQQFMADHNETAFAALVQRHGAMVLGVCRSVLGQQQDAEDVFQAAFLVLARKAGSVRKQEALSSWLHGVAYRLALKARSRRRSFSALVEDVPTSDATDDLTVRELRAIVHEELDRLGDKYRTPLLLCYWEGKTRDEAAEQLGISADVFKKRLERARNLLGSRLVRRGVAPSAALLTALLANAAQAAVSVSLINNTACAAGAFASGSTAGVSATAATLANGAILIMNLTKYATIAIAVLLIGIIGVGAGLASYRLAHSEPIDALRLGVEDGQPPRDKGAQPAKSDKDRIVGVWRVKSLEENGAQPPLATFALMRLTFAKDGGLIISVVDEAKRGSFKIGSGQIDFIDPDNKPSPGIYKFDGNDAVTICIGQGERPKKFSGVKDSGQALFQLQRCKPGEEKPTKEEIEKVGGANKLRDAASRAISVNNLKQIGLAFHSFHDVEKELPAHAIYSKDGKTPLLSWRVALLPYVDQFPLYKQFKLDEPWNSEHNKKLIDKMPQVYAMPGMKAKKGDTYYVLITGPGTLFDGAKRMKLQDITDGTSSTLLAVEENDPVIWTKPDDLPMPKDKNKLPALSRHFGGGFHVVRCDGSVSFIEGNIAAARFRALVTPAAGD